MIKSFCGIYNKNKIEVYKLNALAIVLAVLYIIGCGVLITMILMQKKRQAGFSSTLSGMGGSQTYWDKNKGRSLEGSLEKYSKIGGALFFIITVVTWFIR